MKRNKKKRMKVLLKLVVVLVILISLLSFKFSFFIVMGSSMEPTYSNKSLVVYERKPKKVNRDSVILFKKDDVNYVKRVIGVEGDKLELIKGKFYLNGKFICEGGCKNDLGVLPFETIPKGYAFCVGDNRDNSVDSRDRYFGLVNLDEEIIGLVLN